MRREELEFLTGTEFDKDVNCPFFVVLVLVDTNLASASNACS